MKGLVMSALASALCEVSDVSRSRFQEKWCNLTQCTTTTPALLEICNVSSLHCFALWLVSKCMRCTTTSALLGALNVSSWPGWSLVHYQGATTLIETDSEQLIHGKVHRGTSKKDKKKCFWTKMLHYLILVVFQVTLLSLVWAARELCMFSSGDCQLEGAL